MRRKVSDLRFAKIEGYFPTPVELVAEMVHRAYLPEGADGLEASTDGRGWDANHERARLLAEASPQMLALLETVLDVCDMADPKHENFADSAADCLQVILENEERIRAIVAKARGKA